MYKEKIEKLFRKIKKRNDVEIHSCIISPAISNIKREAIFQEFDIHHSLVEFYNELNGFQLSYTYKTNKEFNKNDFGYYDGDFPPMWPNENYWHLDGCINILPLDLIYRNNWKDYIWFDSQNDSMIVYKGASISRLNFEKQVRPLDVFSKVSIAAMYTNKNFCDILLSTDHNSSFTDYLPISFESYLKGVIETEALLDQRKELFEISTNNN